MVTLLDRSKISLYPDDCLIMEMYPGIELECEPVNFSNEIENNIHLSNFRNRKIKLSEIVEINGVDGYYIFNSLQDWTEDIKLLPDNIVYKVEFNEDSFITECKAQDVKVGDFLYDSNSYKKYITDVVDKSDFTHDVYMSIIESSISINSRDYIEIQKENIFSLRFEDDEEVEAIFVDSTMVKNQ